MDMKFEVNDEEFAIISVEGECEMIHTKDQSSVPIQLLLLCPTPPFCFFMIQYPHRC